MKRVLLLAMTASLMFAGCAVAASEPGAPPSPTASLTEVPCVIDKVEGDHVKAAADEARALADRKAAELVDPENRADRANNRLKGGQSVTVEGGSSHHRLSLGLPTVTVHNTTKSFDFIEGYMGQARTKVVRMERCTWKVGPFSTRHGTCARESWASTNVPMVRNKHVEFSLPSKIDIGQKTQEFSYDLPTVTQRDNRTDFEHAKADVERIKRELDTGKAAIADRQAASTDDAIKKTLDDVEKTTLAAFDQNVSSQTAMFAKTRADLTASRDQARAAYAAAKDPHGADATFAQAFTLLDQAEANAKTDADLERQQIVAKVAEMRKDYLVDHKTPQCAEKTKDPS